MIPPFEEFAGAVVEFMREHAAWTAPVAFLVAFAESLALISLFIPATVILLGIGALVSTGAAGLVEVAAGAIAGAVLGNTVSYWIGRRFKHAIAVSWPFRKRPELLRQGHNFFLQHGGKSVFIGRFFGPTRAAVPLVAGMAEMPRRRFLVANALSAIVWVILSISPGLMSGSFLPNLMDRPAEARTQASARTSLPSVPLR